MRYFLSYYLGFQMALITVKLIGETSFSWFNIFIPTFISIVVFIIMFFVMLHRIGKLISAIEEFNDEYV